jgi:uncharacterized protein YndB with AHSA1/START domain
MQDKLVVRKQLSASPAEVFAAWIDPESVAEWMSPSGEATDAKLDPRVGGSYRLVMRMDGKEFEHRGEYRVVDPPSKLVFTWRSPGTDFKDTLVTVEIKPRGTGSEIVLTHEGFTKQEAVDGHTKGWTAIMERLEAATSAARGDQR